VGVFDRFFGLGRGRDIRAARRVELRGDLEKAVELYGLASAPEEAARVMVLRGDAETDVRVRMRHYTQAVATAPEGHPVRDEARRKRATLLISQFGGTALSEGTRRELRAAAEELLAVGDAAHAAEAFRLAADREGEAKALQAAGDVESLELLLTEQQRDERRGRQRSDVHQEVELLASSGRRREALAAAERWIASHDDASLRDRAAAIRGRRAAGPIVEVALRETRVTLALGGAIVIGRTEGTLRVPSQAVSRRHVRIVREGADIVVRDLGTRNGTQLRGMSLRGAIPVPADSVGLDLTLGKEVHVRIAASDLVEGAVSIELAGHTYIAPLGPARVPQTPWTLGLGADDWVELVAHGRPPYLGDMSLAEMTTLFLGDALADERNGPVVLHVAPKA
jgi:FHA domain